MVALIATFFSKEINLTKQKYTQTQYITRQLSWHVSYLLTLQPKPENGSDVPGFHYKGH